VLCDQLHVDLLPSLGKRGRYRPLRTMSEAGLRLAFAGSTRATLVCRVDGDGAVVRMRAVSPTAAVARRVGARARVGCAPGLSVALGRRERGLVDKGPRVRMGAVCPAGSVARDVGTGGHGAEIALVVDAGGLSPGFR